MTMARGALRLIAFLGVTTGSVMLSGRTAVHAGESQPSSPANGTATPISEETLRSLVALTIDRKRHPLKVDDVTAFLAQFGPVHRDEVDHQMLHFSASKQPQVKAAVSFSTDVDGKWGDPECIFYVIDPPRSRAIFKTLDRLVREELGKPWRTKAKHGQTIAVWNFKKPLKVWLSMGVTAVPDSNSDVDHVELSVAKEPEEFED